MRATLYGTKSKTSLGSKQWRLKKMSREKSYRGKKPSQRKSASSKLCNKSTGPLLLDVRLEARRSVFLLQALASTNLPPSWARATLRLLKTLNLRISSRLYQCLPEQKLKRLQDVQLL